MNECFDTVLTFLRLNQKGVASRSHPFLSNVERGFTMIELIVVIIILVILCGVAAPRFFEAAPYQRRAASDEILTMLRYAQKYAIS